MSAKFADLSLSSESGRDGSKHELKKRLAMEKALRSTSLFHKKSYLKQR